MMALHVILFLLAGGAAAAVTVLSNITAGPYAAAATVLSNITAGPYDSGIDWDGVRKTIIEEIEAQKPAVTLAPLLLRLGWHASGTFDPYSNPHGGSANAPHGGATMRFQPESDYEENNGLDEAREALGRVAARHVGVEERLADLWVLASYVAVEYLEGPAIVFREGRTDAIAGGVAACPPEERLPRFDDPHEAIRKKFERMGMSPKELVALMGAHTVGNTNPENSGFPSHHWDNTPQKFDNVYFQYLLQDWWIYDDEVVDHPYYRNR